MTFIQRLIFAFVSPAMREAMRRESESWVWTCPHCQAQRNVWEAGGVRYKAYARGKYNYQQCAACGKRSWMPMTKLGAA